MPPVRSESEGVSLADAAAELNKRLPPPCEFALRTWEEAHGGDYYGALKVAAQYCGLSTVPHHFPGVWQHGMIPPWHRFRPEIVVFDAARSQRCYVTRRDEAEFLRAGGYLKAQAIGLPLIYTKHSGFERIPGSLLVMPTHTLASDVLLPSCNQYVEEIASISSRFSRVVACVSAYCISKNHWVPDFAKRGIPIVQGAGIADANSLERMRALFDSFEYVTTDSYGSHAFYALYCGAKVSIWGTGTAASRENVLRDGGWSPYPDAVDQLFSAETERNAEAYLAPLRVEPWKASQNIELGREMLGFNNKLSPEEMRTMFGWTPLRNLVGSAVALGRQTRLWKAGGSAKRRLLSRSENLRKQSGKSLDEPQGESRLMK
jgi:hypothetical protein